MLQKLENRLKRYRPTTRTKGEAGHAAVLIAVTQSTHPKLLLTRRADHPSSHAGEVALPSGKHDSGDSSLMDTALCESTVAIG